MRPQTISTLQKAFVGRSEELRRLGEMLSILRVAGVYGIAGVGKSSVALAHAARAGRPYFYQRALTSDSLTGLIDAIRRQVAGGPVEQLHDDQERIAALARMVDDHEALLVIDDVHHLSMSERQTLVQGLSRVLLRGHLLFTSREIVPLEPRGPDRFELRLDGLDRESAEMLWDALGELYGSVPGFQEAFDQTRGHPLLLRQAHAGRFDEDDPIGTSILDLSPESLRLARLVGLAELSLPLSSLERLFSEGAVRTASRDLLGRSIVALDDRGHLTIHDLFRQALRTGLCMNPALEEERRTLLTELIAIVDAQKIDPVLRAREGARLRRLLGDHRTVAEFLLGHARELVRQGAAAELLEELEDLPDEARSLPVRIAHARALARSLRHADSHRELRELMQRETEPSIELKLTLGQIATVVGGFDEATRTLEDVMNLKNITPEHRIRALTAWILLKTQVGEGAEARSTLYAHERTESNPFYRGVLASFRAFSLWLDELDHETEEPIATALAAYPKTAAHRAAVMWPATFAGCLARLGRMEEAHRLFSQAKASLARNDDPLLHTQLTAICAALAFEEGDRLRALEEFRATARAFSRGGAATGLLWSKSWVGRTLLSLGRCREARALLEETRLAAERIGLKSVVRSVENAERSDPLLEYADPDRAPSSPAKLGEVIRYQSMEALRAASRDDRLLATQLAHWVLNDAPTLGDPAGYALDRAIAHLTLSLLSRREGTSAAAQWRERALFGAQRGEFDLEVLLELERAAASPDHVATSVETSLDVREHVLSVDGRRLPLRERPVLRRLLYAMMASPGIPVSKEELVHAVWCREYHPLRDDNALRVNLTRLRSLLTGSGLLIERDEEGYRIVVPAGFRIRGSIPGPRSMDLASARSA